MLEEWLKIFLDDRRGLPDDFWGLTPGEARDIIRSVTRNLKREREIKRADLKTRIVVARNEAWQIAESVGFLIDKRNRHARTLSEYYPDLFEPEVMTLESYTTGFVAWAKGINAMRAAKRAAERAEDERRDAIWQEATEARRLSKGSRS